MTNLRPEPSWVGDETDHLTGYAETWRLDELDDVDDHDEDDEDEDQDAWTAEPA